MKRNRTPKRRVDEIFDRLGDTSVFSKMDLKNGYNQVRISPKYIKKTEFNSEYGHFKFLVL